MQLGLLSKVVDTVKAISNDFSPIRDRTRESIIEGDVLTVRQEDDNQSNEKAEKDPVKTILMSVNSDDITSSDSFLDNDGSIAANFSNVRYFTSILSSLSQGSGFAPGYKTAIFLRMLLESEIFSEDDMNEGLITISLTKKQMLSLQQTINLYLEKLLSQNKDHAIKAFQSGNLKDRSDIQCVHSIYVNFKKNNRLTALSTQEQKVLNRMGNYFTQRN